MLIKEVPKEERPREKAIKYDFESLSNAEVLAIILRTGYKGHSVLSLASSILKKYPLSSLNKMSYQQLISIKGIKTAKALDLLACFELSKRIHAKNMTERDVINSPYALNAWLKSEMGSLLNEHFLVVNLDTKNHVINYQNLFVGTIDMSIVHPREIFRFAIESNAAKIICAHNHPSGDITPSKQDIYITKKLIEAGKLVGIEVIDHVIVSNHEVYSIIGNL